MYQVKIFSVIAVFLLSILLCLEHADAMPYGLLSRQKRISDQRLAELETLIALSKMKGKLVTIPIGFGKTDLDPIKIGRKKRSVEELIRILSKDISSEENSEPQEEFLPERNEIDDEKAQDEYDLYKNLLYNKLLRTNFNELPK